MIAHQPEPTLGVESRTVEGDDARRLLSPVLQRMQPQRGDRGGVGMAEDAEYAAFLAQAVGIDIEALGQVRLAFMVSRVSGRSGAAPAPAAAPCC